MTEPERIARAWFEEVWNRGEEAAIDRLMLPQAAVHGFTPEGAEPMRGGAGFKALYRQFRGALPDLRIEVTQTVVEGDRVAAHCRVTGTHTGPELGLEPTGRPIRIEGICIARIADGRIVEGWNAFDFLTLYKQIGALGTPGAPAT